MGLLSDAYLKRLQCQWRQAVIAAIIFSAAGCAQLSPMQQQPPERAAGVEPLQTHPRQAWWKACFSMPFDENGEPRWSMDELLADLVAAPAIERHADKIPLWRFHRRAAHDGAGHRFSLLFYTDRDTAEQIFSELEKNPLLPDLTDSNYLARLTTHCDGKQIKPELEATSDPSWDIRLQRTWPHFIMGVSAHWLALIEEVGQEFPAASDRPKVLLARYEKIHDEIDRIWLQQGQHAYLHHLSALFGYRPMRIQKLIEF